MPAIRPRSRLGIVLAALSALALALAGPADAHGGGKGANVYKKRNLVSDIDGVARITDPNLVNPWGLAFGPATPAWVSDNGTDVSTLYSGGVRKSIPVTLPLVVGIPGGAPTGVVFNATGGFKVDGVPAHFIFDSEAGTITAWNSGTQAVTEATTPGAVYKGLAIASKGSADHALRRDFHTGKIDVFNDVVRAGHRARRLRRPQPAGRLRAVQRPGDRRAARRRLRPAGPQIPRDELHGPGLGYVDVFDTQRPPAAAADLPGRPERPLGPGGRPTALRAVQRRPARGQLRRRGDQRLRPADRRLPRHADRTRTATRSRSTASGRCASATA